MIAKLDSGEASMIPKDLLSQIAIETAALEFTAQARLLKIDPKILEIALAKAQCERRKSGLN